MKVNVKFNAGIAHTERETDWDKLTKQLLNHFTTEQVILWHHKLLDGEPCKATRLSNGIRMTITPV